VAVASIASWPDNSIVGEGVTPGGKVEAGSPVPAVTSGGADDLERVHPETKISATTKKMTIHPEFRSMLCFMGSLLS
jgi:hypothetical protein